MKQQANHLNQWDSETIESVTRAYQTGTLLDVKKALNKIKQSESFQKSRKIRIGILRTYTIEPLLEYLYFSISMLSVNPTIILGKLDNIEQELLDSKSDLLKSNLDIIIILWRLEELHSNLVWAIDSMSLEQRKHECNIIIDRVRSLVDSYQGSAPLFLSTILLPPSWVGSIHDHHRPYGIAEIVYRINLVIYELSASSNIYVVDIFQWMISSGLSALDHKMDIFARLPIAASHSLSYTNFISKSVKPFFSTQSKVLAVDLDNTLWGGVLGEDGIQNLLISNDNIGITYWRLQQFILSLKRRGIILVLLSKNNISDVENAFKQLDHMPIKLSDFASVKVDWNDKYINLQQSAQDLGLGVDSFVFLDDQPYEQEQMHQSLPNVKVLFASKDPVSMLNSLVNSGYFDSYYIDNEDLLRNKDYQNQIKRKQMQSKLNKNTFLLSLEMKVIVDQVSEKSIHRVSQMLLKTNQFNLTTKRHSMSVLQTFMGNHNNLLLTIELSDRFGDQGIVGAILGVANKDNIYVDTFLLSCRAIGRGVEDALWACFVEKAHMMGYVMISAEYVGSGKNDQVKNLYSRLGMNNINADCGSDRNNIVYEMNVSNHIIFPEWIEVIRR
jgi:FkbH-like protein